MKGKAQEKIIIIGGGIAGLCAGVYARLAGFEAEIYEKNPVVGGQCMGWNRAGFHIDNCIHWLTGSREDTAMYRVWKTVGALDERTKFADINEFYTSMYQGKSATLWNDLARTKKELLELAPEDREEIEKLIEHVEYAKDCLFPAEKPMEMMGIRDYMKMGRTMANVPKVMKEYAGISLEELSSRFQNPVLRQMLYDYMPKEYTASSFLVSYATMASGNGKVPLGGSLAMALRIREKFLSLGGKIYSNHPVKSVMIEKGRAVGIELENGAKVSGDYIISTVDASVLFRGMLDQKYMPRLLAEAYADEKSYPVISGFQAAFALKGAFSRRGTVLFDCRPFSAMGREISRFSVKIYDYDEIYQKDGKTVLQSQLCQGHGDYRFWKNLSAEEYAARKLEYAEAMKSRIEETFPETKGNLELLDVWTPLTYERYCGAYHGSYMSFVTTAGTKSCKLDGTLKGLRNFYLSGQWAMAPGGLPVAASMGKFAIQRILKRQHKNINLD